MEGSGLISGELTPPVGRGPARKVYKLTPKGDSAINSAVLGILRSPQRKYSNFLLAMDNLMRIQGSQAVTALNENKSELAKLLNAFSKLIEHHPMKDNFYITEFFGFITHQLESELDWLEGFIDRYQSHIRNVNSITEQESNE